MIFIVCLIVMTFMGAVASLFFKKASGANGIFETIKSINLYVGVCLYGAAALLNIWILRYLDYSVVLPLTSLTYIWTMVLSYFFLKERISKKKILGVVLILAGAIFVSM